MSHSVAIDNQHRLVFLGGRKADFPAMGEYGKDLVYVDFREPLRVAISDNANNTWDLGDVARGNADFFARVARLDTRSVVIDRTSGNYGLAEQSVKFFFDLMGRRVLKTIAFDRMARVTKLELVRDRVCATVHTADVRLQSCGRESGQAIEPNSVLMNAVPPPLPHPSPESYLSPLPADLPQSTYDQFARARPRRVRDGYGPGSRIEERIGDHQSVGDRIWFGKTFYDGEGLTGVGAIGYFDTRSKQFTTFAIPELYEWSVSKLLVERDAVWIGLVNYPEGASRGGGLLRYDLSTRRVVKYSVPNIILSFLRHDNSLYIGTDNGLYVLRDNRLTRFRFEPALDGGIEVIQDIVPL